MTTIALNYSRNLLEGLLSAIVNTFSSYSKAVIMARGVEVNYKIAGQLRHEYPNMDVPEIAAMLNERLRQEVYGD